MRSSSTFVRWQSGKDTGQSPMFGEVIQPYLHIAVLLKVLEPTTSSQSSLEAVWWLDLELTNEPSENSASATIDTPAGLIPSDSSLGKVLAQHFDSAREISGEGDKPQSSISVFSVIFGKVSGYAARSDFLEYRFQGAEEVRYATSFLKPSTSVLGASPEQLSIGDSAEAITDLLQKSIGVVVSHVTTESHNVDRLRKNLDKEFLKRLSVPFILPEPARQSRVFWVQGRADIESSQQFYHAAQALGITIVVLDQDGHWLQDNCGPYSHLREAFIPVSVDGDDGLAQRIVEAVKSYPHKVDGIVTISDVRLPFVARACEILGLPTSPSAAYFLAGDKGATRKLEDRAANEKDGIVLEAAADLETVLSQLRDSIQYPLIVKPCTGWNSDCVAKVCDQDELYAAVRRASTRHADSPNKSTKVVIEPYIDGPEVDANFIMLDGEVLFCDISDDFPSLGDLKDGEMTSAAANFMETLMDVPTALPVDEQQVLKDGLTRSISRLGFQSGIFHCEARVRNSRAQYRQDADGIVDLHAPDRGGSEKRPSCYLHEVNARSPGYINCVAALLAYGIDYYAVRLLLSLGDHESYRVRVLSQPFLGNKPQYTLGVVVLPPTRAGIMASTDAISDFLDANPALRTSVVHHQILRKRGEFVEGPDSSELLAVGYIIVASREGRRECLQLAKRIRDSFDYRLVED
ncbi:hypothetical protein FB567DRAFT_80170 [Paraphoma chrysanthemicola]|uniref:ATP-grasp domain-containing protein n=1 Tax=Paraphoma chrysanthemicola TaxID=798071 RepID=A0A8K0R1W1_9PLEO|nr:hypothetical protein FB567DRAFT_80170 [Paraphoma chrysanthemicola]